MKYTKQQAERLKEKGMDGYTRYNRPLPDVIIKDGFYIVESKLNKIVSKEPSKFWKESAERQAKRMYSDSDMRIAFDANIKDWISYEEFIEQFSNNQK